MNRQRMQVCILNIQLRLHKELECSCVCRQRALSPAASPREIAVHAPEYQACTIQKAKSEGSGRNPFYLPVLWYKLFEKRSNLGIRFFHLRNTSEENVHTVFTKQRSFVACPQSEQRQTDELGAELRVPMLRPESHRRGASLSVW